jgi:hypothetical protein
VAWCHEEDERIGTIFLFLFVVGIQRFESGKHIVES